MKIRDIIINKDHALVPLSRNKFAIIDLEDIDKVKDFNWYALKVKRTFYAARLIAKTKEFILMHRILLNPSNNFQVDHKDNDGLNNKRSNLRLATKIQNDRNRKSYKGTSKYKGVWFSKRDQKWKSTIYVNRKQINIGTFINEIDAAKAYDKKAKELFGEFAKLNLE